MTEETRSTAQSAANWLADIGVGTWTWDPAAGVVAWDPATEAVYGLDTGSFPGTFDAYLNLIHPDDRDEVVKVIGEVATMGGDYSIRHRVVWPNGVVRWVEGQGRITVDETGQPLDGRGIVYALTDRVTFDKERAELTASEEVARADLAASRERLRFLIDLTDAIAGTLNTERVARQFVSLITGRLASACIVDVQLQEPFGHLFTCVGHSTRGQHVTSGTPLTLPAATARLGTPLDGSGRLPESILDVDTPEQAKIVDEPGAKYVSAVPLMAHGTRIGTAVAVRTGRAWSRESRELLEAACRRAAGAFDRAELHADRSKFVAMFQAAATPRDLPRIPGLDLAAHYRPATDLIRLGGDLYDVFPLPGGSWMLVVGDICGKGIVAAGHAELARTALRAAAVATEDPVETLRVLNRTLLTESTRPMLTAAVAKVTPTSGQATFEVAVAGHPPPLLVQGLDDWRVLEVKGTMLGVTEQPKFERITHVLESGQSVALYTDGVTESRFGSTFFGVDRLGKTLSKGWSASANALVGDVASTIDAWAAGQPSDDLLLMVARCEG